MTKLTGTNNATEPNEEQRMALELLMRKLDGAKIYSQNRPFGGGVHFYHPSTPWDDKQHGALHEQFALALKALLLGGAVTRIVATELTMMLYCHDGTGRNRVIEFDPASISSETGCTLAAAIIQELTGIAVIIEPRRNSFAVSCHDDNWSVRC